METDQNIDISLIIKSIKINEEEVIRLFKNICKSLLTKSTGELSVKKKKNQLNDQALASKFKQSTFMIKLSKLHLITRYTHE